MLKKSKVLYVLCLVFIMLMSANIVASAESYYYKSTNSNLDAGFDVNKKNVKKAKTGAFFNAKVTGNVIYLYGKLDRYTLQKNKKYGKHWLTEYKKHHFKVNSATKYFEGDGDEEKPVSKKRMLSLINSSCSEDDFADIILHIYTSNGYVKEIHYESLG